MAQVDTRGEGTRAGAPAKALRLLLRGMQGLGRGGGSDLMFEEKLL